MDVVVALEEPSIAFLCNGRLFHFLGVLWYSDRSVGLVVFAAPPDPATPLSDQCRQRS